jgi:Concanavalin A-like lectin/glucanases superfamily/Domain of unknown function (DUF1929)/Bacterial Ig domain/IPT/TIG domain/Kelch motif
MLARPHCPRISQLGRFLGLIFASLLLSCLSAYGQTRNLTVAVLVNSQNPNGFNPSPSSPGEYQRFAERYLEHLQVPYELFDVATALPPGDLDSRQLVIAAHSGLLLSGIWRDAVVNAVSNGVGFVNLDSHPDIGSQSHIAAIFAATGSAAGTPATQITIPPAVAPNGTTPHYIAALQKKFDSPNGQLVYAFHAGADGIIHSATSTVLLNAQGTVIARLGNDPLILATTYGAGRAVHFGTLDYLHGDRLGFEMGLDDLFWRSLVWAARKPFVVRGYPRLWAVQMDDTRAGWGTRVRDMYNPSLTGQTSADGTGGPWKVTGYLFTDNLPRGSIERAQVIADINARLLEVSPHSFADVSQGNMYWSNVTGALTDQEWQTNMSAIDAWKQGNGGTDVIPSYSRSMVPHFWNLSDNTGWDLWNRFGFRYITTIQKPGFKATDANNGAERLPLLPFWNYEMPPKTFVGSYTSEDYPFVFADDLVVRSRGGLPPQSFYLFATQYVDYAKYQRVDFAWPFASPTSLSVADSVALLEQYTWRFWSGLGPVQLFTHDAINYENAGAPDRQAAVRQSAAWLNANGARHIFMDDLGDYIFARNRSKLTRVTFDGTQVNYAFTGKAVDPDGNPIPTQTLVFQGDTEGAWQTAPGFSSGLQLTRALPPAVQSVIPSSGSSSGGTTVTLSGSGFTADSIVIFGQNSATSTTFVNSSTLTAITPAGPETAVPVKLANNNGSSILTSGFTYVPPPRVLIGAYAFNEGSGATVADSSGNGNNGTVSNTTWSTAGKFGSALSFNGSSSWVTVNDANNLDLTTGMTLEAWVNPAALGTIWRTTIMKEQSGGLVYSLYANTDTSRPSGHVFVGSEQDTRGTTALALNSWTHLAVTYDGATLRLYINGTEVSSKPLSGSIHTSTGVLRIGGNSIWGEYFSGLIDEIRIYNRALTTAEIQNDMNAPIGVSDTAPPTVSLTAPSNGASVSGAVTVSANATDNVGVAGVQFLLDGAPLGAEDTTSPYSLSWNSATVANGAHTLSARARDAVGNTTTSAAVMVTVSNAPDTTPPTVAMTAPAEGATVSGSVTVSAAASDNVGVVGVQFLLDGAALGAEDTTSPYSISWNSGTSSSGPHTLSARARDAAGNVTTSAVVNVTNVPPDTTPPVVSMTAPPGGTTVSGLVTVSADASDNVGVVGVQFLLDGAPLGIEDTSSPYSIAWNSATAVNGSHSLSARARDTAGNQTTSTAVTVTVTGGVTSGLVAAYGFDEGSGTAVADSSGNSNNGTASNTTWTTAGKFGSALSFNGSSSWVTVNDANSLDLTAGMTLEAWVNPSALGTAWRTAIMKEATGGLAYGLYGNSDTTRPSGHVFVGSEQDTRGTTALALNSWTHLAMTFNGTTLRIFVNGIEASNKAISGTVRVTTGPLRIGGNSIWGEYFSGLIDEIRIYNRALTTAEIQNDMNAPINPPTPPPTDTVPPTISVIAPAASGTVAGLTTLYANASDNIGVIGVQFYIDGAPFGSEIGNQPYTTTWNTATATNASHTITAVARDGANNITTSAGATVTVANTNNPSVIGAWGAPFNWPIVAINMVVTRTGEVMSWDGPPSNGGTSAQLWNPSTGVFTAIPNNLTNMFCNSAVALSDGRILAIGGHADFGVGVPDADIYDPVTKLWSRMASMKHGRWYPTATVLPDGRVLAMSGSDTCESCIVAIPEIYDPVTDLWTEMPSAAFSVPIYPLMFLLPDGRVLEAGATRAPTVTRVLDLNTQTWTTVDPTPRDGHSAVMYEPGKIMKSGTSADVNDSNAPSESTTFTLDMTQPTPKWQQTPNMAYPRAFHTLTQLPDGSVLATSGGSTQDGVDYANSVLAAEIWSPVTRTWSTMSAQQNGRLYHGNAVLLLDGRVLVAGSGRVGPAPQFNAEIFSPPYLFKGPRPSMTSVPAEADYGSTLFVATPDATNITSITLLRLSAATHAFNMDQRILRLSFSQAAGGVNVQAPANGNLAPPGYYVLFIVNGSGVPSVGAVIRIH